MERQVVHPMHLAPMVSTSTFCFSVLPSFFTPYFYSHLPQLVNHSFMLFQTICPAHVYQQRSDVRRMTHPLLFPAIDQSPTLKKKKWQHGKGGRERCQQMVTLLQGYRIEKRVLPSTVIIDDLFESSLPLPTPIAKNTYSRLFFIIIYFQVTIASQVEAAAIKSTT